MVLALENRRVAALLRADLATLDEILADDLVYTHSSSHVDTKASYLETIRSGKLKYLTLAHRNPTIRVYGTTAVVHGIADVRTVWEDQTGDPYAVCYTMVYVQKNDRWQKVAWQSTRLPGK